MTSMCPKFSTVMTTPDLAMYRLSALCTNDNYKYAKDALDAEHANKLKEILHIGPGGPEPHWYWLLNPDHPPVPQPWLYDPMSKLCSYILINPPRPLPQPPRCKRGVTKTKMSDYHRTNAPLRIMDVRRDVILTRISSQY